MVVGCNIGDGGNLFAGIQCYGGGVGGDFVHTVSHLLHHGKVGVGGGFGRGGGGDGGSLSGSNSVIVATMVGQVVRWW